MLYQTLLSTAYFGLFRIRELTSGSHPVLAQDVHIGANKKKILFLLRTTKTLTEGSKPQTVKISSSSICSHKLNCRQVNNGACPYKLLRKYAKLCGAFTKGKKEPFFCVLRWVTCSTLSHEILRKIGPQES